MNIHNLLLVVAIVCFVLSIVGVRAKLSLTNLGLAFLAGSFWFFDVILTGTPSVRKTWSVNLEQTKKGN